MYVSSAGVCCRNHAGGHPPHAPHARPSTDGALRSRVYFSACFVFGLQIQRPRRWNGHDGSRCLRSGGWPPGDLASGLRGQSQSESAESAKTALVPQWPGRRMLVGSFCSSFGALALRRGCAEVPRTKDLRKPCRLDAVPVLANRLLRLKRAISETTLSHTPCSERQGGDCSQVTFLSCKATAYGSGCEEHKVSNFS